jgi:HSP20 family protein
MFSNLLAPKNRNLNRSPALPARESDKQPLPTRTPAVSVKETDQQFALDVALPGVAPEQAHLSVDQGVLTIRGTRQAEELADMKLIHQEYAAYDFVRHFTLPDEVDSQAIQATAKDGILHVILPKIPAAQPRRIHITTAA